MMFQKSFMDMKDFVKAEFRKCFNEAAPFMIELFNKVKAGNDTQEDKYDLCTSDLKLFYQPLSYINKNHDESEEFMANLMKKHGREYVKKTDPTITDEALVVEDQNFQYVVVMHRIRNDEIEKRTSINIFCCSDWVKDYPTLEEFIKDYDKHQHRPIYKIEFGHYADETREPYDLTGSLSDVYYFPRLERLLMNLESIECIFEMENAN